LDTLYQKQILQLAQHSRNSNFDPDAPFQASYDNPTCGDRVTVSFSVKGDLIFNLGLEVRGCALCEAGAGLAINCLTGNPVNTVYKLTKEFSAWMDGAFEHPPIPEMKHFLPIRNIRNRHKCVLLAFNASVKALKTESTGR
jgi:nitrogen fixation NifU-like protein